MNKNKRNTFFAAMLAALVVAVLMGASMPTSAWDLGDGSDDDSAEWRDEYSVPVDSHQAEDDATRLGLFAFG